jgi:hypothetical protein
MTALSGTSADVDLIVRSGSGRVVRRERGAMLFTHFGISGPVVLDISRHWVAARADGDGATLVAAFVPGATFDDLDARIVEDGRRNGRATVGSLLRGLVPERLAGALAASCSLDSSALLARLGRESRRRLVHALIEHPLPVVSDRGFEYAEVTAGGVPLSEIDLATMESRRCAGLFLCGEILDVDGKIGGYNFQWAWASGRLAGLGARRVGEPVSQYARPSPSS